MRLDWKKIQRPIIALSPMADMTDSAFCQTVKDVASPVVFREMVSAEAVVRDNERTREMAAFVESGKEEEAKKAKETERVRNEEEARNQQIIDLRNRMGKEEQQRRIEEQKRLEEDLLKDPKEIAEHTMLLDLWRNDLGRVCKYGSIRVTEIMKLQKYSHVIHLVSKVEGEIANDKDSIDALMSCFPAGTVSGAPKIRAIQLINDFEKNERNVYAGAVGYFDFSGNLDMCIAIRTLFTNGKTIFWQSGAGIVSDSKPELELKEIKNKSAALVTALKYAEVIDENISD